MKAVIFCLLGLLVLHRVSADGCAPGVIGVLVQGTNCLKFKTCANGLIMECPTGKIFVDGRCQSSETFACDDTTTTGGSNNAQLCGNGKDFGAYPDNCAAFVDCTTNSVLRCPNGMLYDVERGVCQPSAIATCYEGSGDTIPQYIKDYCSTVPAGSIVGHKDCSKYYICDGAIIEVANCPAGKHFSRAYNGCVPILKAGCVTLGAACVAQPKGFSFPGLVCSEYYTCPANNVPQLNNCPSGQQYNPNTAQCDSSYNCNDDIIVPGPSTNNPPTEPVTIPTTTTTPKGPTPSDPKTQCAKAANGYKVADPTDCTKYYLCNEGSAIELNCYSGQYFNSANQLCSTSNSNSKC